MLNLTELDIAIRLVVSVAGCSLILFCIGYLVYQECERRR